MSSDDDNSNDSTDDAANSTINWPACFRHKTQGVYKTFNKGDFTFTVLDWAYIHDGTCQCEGKTADDCQEPGDNN